MDDRFLSRGKSKDSGEWVEGCLVFSNIIIPCTNDNMFFPYMRVSDCMTIENGTYITKDSRLKFYIVDPETVGGCTGLTDKNDKPIFEGDIVTYGDTDNRYYGNYAVAFEQRGGCAYFGIKINDNETWQFCLEVHPKIMEVIGNIHDNPELLESEVTQSDP